MTARRDSSNEPARGSYGGRALLTAAVVFALAATGVLIVSDELKWLRLGIVAALWAALVGAFLAARYRRQVTDQEDVAAERQERYELELEREVAARREYELEFAADAKRQADEGARDDIAALRQELFGLRQTLESLLGGEFLVERYALRAESTRMRSLPDDRSLKRLPPAKPKEENVIPSVVQEAQTDLIERVREVHQAPKRKVEPLPRRAERPNGRTEFPTPEPIKSLRVEHTPHPAELSDRWFVPDGLGTNQEPPAKPADSQPYAARQYVRQDQTQYVAKEEPRNRYPGGNESRTQSPRRTAAESTAYAEPTGTPNRHSTVASGYMEPISRPRGDGYPPPSPAESSGYGPGTSGYLPSVARPEPPGLAANGTSGRLSPAGTNGSSGYMPPVGRPDPYAAANGSSGNVPSVSRPDPFAGANGSSGYQPAVGRPDPYAGANGSSGYVPSVGRPDPFAGASGSSGYVPPVVRAESSGYVVPTNRAESSAYVPPVGRPDTSGYVVPVNRGEPPAGRRRTHSDDPPADRGGGRRRRAEGQPTWQESRQNGGAADAEPTGSHAAGRSVSELLATHGSANSPSTPHRRRRREG